MNRTLIIGAAVIVLAGVGVWIYFNYFATQTGITVTTPGETGLPSAGSVPGESGETQTINEINVAEPEKVTARLVQIDKGPVVAGEVVLNVLVLPNGTIATSTNAASTTPDIEVRYLARQSGNIFSYLVRAGSLTRISNKTLPGIQEAEWLPNGSIAYVRYLSGINQSVINTYALPASGGGGFFLSQDIVSLAVSSSSILSLASGANGSVGSLTKPDGSGEKQVFTTPLSSLRASFAGKSSYLAFTKPSATLDGYAFLINSAGRSERIAGPTKGLTALASPSGKWVLVSSVSGSTLKMSLLETATGTILPLPVGTVVDKCVWAPDESAVYCGVPVDPPSSFAYPDDWYQGAVAFSDRIWKIDVTGRFAELILDFSKETSQSLDAVNLTIDQALQALVFKNKNDSSLWVYTL